MKTNNDDDTKPCDISDLMEKFGKYQIIQYTLICLPALCITMISINYVFVAGDTGYRCRIDECEDLNSSSQFPSWWPDKSIDRCYKPVLKSGVTVCTNNSFTGELVACNSWIYESNNNTIVAELDLACQPWSLHLVGSIHSTGMLVSVFVFGWLADKFGRKPIYIMCVVGGCIGIIKTFSTSYYMYVTVEFLEATITGGSYPAALVLLSEMVGKKYRVLSGVVVAYVISFGEILFAIIGMFVHHWKTLFRIINGPCIFFIVYIFFINESPRWQIVSGRVEKAKTLMKKIADTNNIHLNKEELANIDEVKLKKMFNIESNEIKESYINVFKSKEIMKRVLVACLSRFTATFVFYGLIINLVWLPGNKYLFFLLSCLMSLPGELICVYLMNKVGRRKPLMIGYFASGVLCIITALIPSNYLWVKLSFFLLGKAIISSCFTGAMTYSVELFPTSVRGSLMGLGELAARLGGILAPLTPIMNTVSEFLPFAIFGFFAILTGSVITVAPETKDLPLFDTIKQLESSQRKEPACSMETASDDM